MPWPYFQKPALCFLSFRDKQFYPHEFLKLHKVSGIEFFVSYVHSGTMIVVPMETTME